MATALAGIVKESKDQRSEVGGQELENRKEERKKRKCIKDGTDRPVIP